MPKSARSTLGHGEYHGAPLQGRKHQHAGGKEHAHKAGSDPHEHLTSAQRFAARYPNGAPFGHVATRVAIAEQQAAATYGPPDAPKGGKGGQWWDRHVLAVILIALIGALALIAVFTPTGETGATIAPVAPTATARIVVRFAPRATATPTARATATPRATPCPAPTLPYCEAPPTEQARPDAGAPAIAPTVAAGAQGASVGGALVPAGLRCMEDEVIGFVAVDTLGCVHVEGRTLEPTNPNTY